MKEELTTVKLIEIKKILDESEINQDENGIPIPLLTIDEMKNVFLGLNSFEQSMLFSSNQLALIKSVLFNKDSK